MRKAALHFLDKTNRCLLNKSVYNDNDFVNIYSLKYLGIITLSKNFFFKLANLCH